MAETSGTRYRQRQRRRAKSSYVMTCLADDAWLAVQKVMEANGYSASGAVHHLVRLGARLKPLNPN